MTPLLPITYQKLNAAWLDHERVPKTTRPSVQERLQERAEVGRLVLEIGVEDRRPFAGRLPEPGLERGALPTIPLVVDERDVVGPLRPRSSSRVPSVEPSSTTTSWRLDRELRCERVVDCRLDRGELVEDRHQDREAWWHRRHRTATRRSTRLWRKTPHGGERSSSAILARTPPTAAEPPTRRNGRRPRRASRRRRCGDRCRDIPRRRRADPGVSRQADRRAVGA